MFYGLILKTVYGLFYRIVVFSFLWYSGPPLLFVVLAWILLRDCDFSLVLANNTPGVDEQEIDYYTNRVCWVTGASSGIGKSLAVSLARRGAFVILSGRNKEKLNETASECQRAFLVSQVKLYHRTESALSTILNESSDIANTRVLLVTLDLLEISAFSSAVRQGLAWKGRIDMLFNNAGVSSRAILPTREIDAAITNINFISPLAILKVIIPHALRPTFTSSPEVYRPGSPSFEKNSATRPHIKFPQIERMSTLEFNTVVSRTTLRSLARTMSIEGFQAGSRFIHKSKIGIALRKIFWGTPLVEYSYSFHVVNIGSVFARLPTPGRSSYGAAKSALAHATDAIKMEVDGQARVGQHATELLVTNCYLGKVRTAFLEKTLLTCGKCAADMSEHAIETAKREHQETAACSLSADRCVELVLRAAATKQAECWVAPQPFITYMYIQYYLPWMWKYISYRFLELPEFKRVQMFNEECENVLPSQRVLSNSNDKKIA